MEIPVWIQDGFFLTGRRSIDGSELFVHWNKASGTPVFFDGSAEICSWFLFFHCRSLPSALPAPTTNVLFSCLFSCNDLSYPGPRISTSPFCFHISSEFQMCFNVSLLPRKVNAASNVIGFILQRIPEKSFKRKVLSWEETHECRTAPHL